MSTDFQPNNIILIDRKITQNQRRDNQIRVPSSAITSENSTRENDPTIRVKTNRGGRGGAVNFQSRKNNEETWKKDDPPVKSETSHAGVVVEQLLSSRNYKKKSNRYDDHRKNTRDLCRHFFTEGVCRFGANCRYSHVDVGAYNDAPNRAHYATDDRSEHYQYSGGGNQENDVEWYDNAESNGAEFFDSRQPGRFKTNSSDRFNPVGSRRPCRFYAAGYCVRGNNCSFPHGEESVENARTRQKQCETSQKDWRQRSRVQEQPLDSVPTSSAHTLITQDAIHGGRDSHISSSHISQKSSLSEQAEITGKQQPRRTRGYNNKSYEEPERLIPCRYLRSGFCRMGNKCKYSHEIRNEDKYSEDRNKDFVKKRCIQDKQGNQDPSEDHSCTDLVIPRDVDRSKEVLPAVQGFSEVGCRPKVQLADGAAARKLEIDQLRKRFPECVETVREDGSSTLKCIFTPTDPDWPYDVKNINIEVTFPEKYPSEMMSVLVSDDGQMPETVRRMVSESMEGWIKSRYKLTMSSKPESPDEVSFDLAFRPMLRWFDKNALEIFTTALKQLKREKMAEAAGIQFIPASHLRKIYNSDQHETEGAAGGSLPLVCDGQKPSEILSKHDNDTVGDQVIAGKIQSDDSLLEGDDSDAKQLDAANPQGGQSTGVTGSDNQQGLSVRRGTEVTLQGFNIGEGVATVRASHVTLVVACARCSRTCEVKSPCSRTNSVACAYCHSVLLVRFNACIAHQFSSVIGYMDLNGCAPVDLVLADSSFIVGCMKCDKEVKMESFAPGQLNTSWCLHCHQKFAVATNSARFLTLPSTTAPQLDSSSACVVEMKKPVRAVKDPLIQEGKPLPAYGTCKHYKKSFRWLRFPCCGKVYPCDICHDEKEDHEMKFANRMICGYCAKEQPFSSEGLCIGCQACLTNRTTAHWEGGTGCRDKIKMSRNDDKKYANGSKTISRSSQAKKDMGKKTTRLRHAL